MRICMLTTSYPLGHGDTSAIFVHYLAKGLVSAGHDVDVVAPSAAGASVKETLDGVQVHRFTYCWPKRWQKLAYGWGIPENLRAHRWLYLQAPIFLLAFFLHALCICRSVDVIHAHWIPSALIGWAVGALLGKPVVLSVHGTDARVLPGFLSRFVLKRVAAVHVVSVEVQDIVQRLGRKGHLIPVMIDEERFNPQADGRPIRAEFRLGNHPVVTFVSRLYDFRDPLTFVRAIPAVLAKRPDLRFAIVGDGPLRPEVERLAKELGIQDWLVIAGMRNDVYRFLGASSVFVALSPVDNVWTCAIAEAMLVGVPCILTASGFTPQFFTHGENCYLVPARDPEALAQAIVTLVNDRQLATRLTNGAYEFLHRQGRRAATVVQNMLALYSQVIAGNQI